MAVNPVQAPNIIAAALGFHEPQKEPQMYKMTLVMAATMLAAANPGAAAAADDDRRDRQYASRGEVQRSKDRVRDERQDVRDAKRYGNNRDVRMEQKDVDRARREYQRDAEDLRRRNQAQYQPARGNGQYWNQGNRYGWDRPDPRTNGYYANDYYRSGNYRTRQIGNNDRIYRGGDNRYYCRRNDGTTGLIVGALGGGVLGNVIAPGGSKTLGSILGGSLGAVLGSQIGGNNVTCR